MPRQLKFKCSLINPWFPWIFKDIVLLCYKHFVPLSILFVFLVSAEYASRQKETKCEAKKKEHKKILLLQQKIKQFMKQLMTFRVINIYNNMIL